MENNTQNKQQGKSGPEKAKTRAENAFKKYVAMGENRSYEKLADLLIKDGSQKVAKKSLIHKIKDWAVKYEWQERLANINLRAEKKNDTELVDMLTKTKMKQRKLINMQLTSLIRSLQKMEKEGREPEFTHMDLVRVMAHELVMEGGNKPADQVPFNPVTMVQVNMPEEVKLMEKALERMPIEFRNRFIRELDAAEAQIKQEAQNAIVETSSATVSHEQVEHPVDEPVETEEETR